MHSVYIGLPNVLLVEITSSSVWLTSIVTLVLFTTIKDKCGKPFKPVIRA